jgi:hypothetical protein
MLKILYNLRFVFFIPLFSLNLLSAQMASPSPQPPDQVDENEADGNIKSLDLEYVYGGDYIMGTLYDKEELTEMIMKYPNLEKLNISGQMYANEEIFALIHDQLPLLKEVKLNGSIRFVNGDGMVYSWQEVNPFVVTPEMLQALVKNHTMIENIHLSLSTVNDEGLEILAMGTPELKEITLRGAEGVTDNGILALVGSLPNLESIDIRPYKLLQPMNGEKIVTTQISKEVIQQIRDRGIAIYDEAD